MINFTKGTLSDLLNYDADIKINTVNCVGVMGAGVALAFKQKHPSMFKAYVSVCRNKDIEPGKPFVWDESDFEKRCTIINLPTKVHWRNPSTYEYIELNLIWLRDYLSEQPAGTTVALPALGCTHGGLDWVKVKSQINKHLSDLPVNITVFDPTRY